VLEQNWHLHIFFSYLWQCYSYLLWSGLFICSSQLFLWYCDCKAIRHPASGYVQGINDLVTPFLVVFLSEHLEGNMDTWSMSNLSAQDISNIEADCYWCLSKFLDGMQDHYTFAQPGIQRLVFRLKELVRRIDGNVSLIPSIPTSGSTFLKCNDPSI